MRNYSVQFQWRNKAYVTHTTHTHLLGALWSYLRWAHNDPSGNYRLVIGNAHSIEYYQ